MVAEAQRRHRQLLVRVGGAFAAATAIILIAAALGVLGSGSASGTALWLSLSTLAVLGIVFPIAMLILASASNASDTLIKNTQGSLQEEVDNVEREMDARLTDHGTLALQRRQEDKAQVIRLEERLNSLQEHLAKHSADTLQLQQKMSSKFEKTLHSISESDQVIKSQLAKTQDEQAELRQAIEQSSKPADVYEDAYHGIETRTEAQIEDALQQQRSQQQRLEAKMGKLQGEIERLRELVTQQSDGPGLGPEDLERAMERMRYELDQRLHDSEEQLQTRIEKSIGQKAAQADMRVLAAAEAHVAREHDAITELRDWVEDKIADVTPSIPVTVGPGPFGRIHPVHDIEGIGNQTAYSLQRFGILDTEHLWHAEAKPLAEALQVTERQVKAWQSQAELMAVNGIGKQWAELLASIGVASIHQLANLQPDELLGRITDAESQHQKVHGGNVGRNLVADWIGRAQAHDPTDAIHV